MKLTPLSRRQRLSEIMDSDPDCSRLLAEYRAAEQRFSSLTDKMPPRLRQLLWQLPGTGYFLHHRILTLVCEYMCFEDENV